MCLQCVPSRTAHWERWNGEGTVQSDWRGDAQPKWPDLGSTEFGEIWRSSIHGVRMLRVGLR